MIILTSALLFVAASFALVSHYLNNRIDSLFDCLESLHKIDKEFHQEMHDIATNRDAFLTEMRDTVGKIVDGHTDKIRSMQSRLEETRGIVFEHQTKLGFYATKMKHHILFLRLLDKLLTDETVYHNMRSKYLQEKERVNYVVGGITIDNQMVDFD